VIQSGTQTAAAGLSNPEILRIVYRYIGVEAGYLGDFSYGSHAEFYPLYCNLDLNPFDYLREGTTRERFIVVLQQSPPHVQAKIVRGVVEKYPAGSSELRTEALRDDLIAMAERLEGGGLVAATPPALTRDVGRPGDRRRRDSASEGWTDERRRSRTHCTSRPSPLPLCAGPDRA
jgi:hypothetical protein